MKSHIIGIDDYSIGHGYDKTAAAALAETVRKLRLMTAFAKERGQVVCISEAGGQKKRKDFWTCLHRAATAEGVSCAFVNTWAGTWGTTPESPEEAADQRAFAAQAEVLMEGTGTRFDCGGASSSFTSARLPKMGSRTTEHTEARVRGAPKSARKRPSDISLTFVHLPCTDVLNGAICG